MLVGEAVKLDGRSLARLAQTAEHSRLRWVNFEHLWRRAATAAHILECERVMHASFIPLELKAWCVFLLELVGREIATVEIAAIHSCCRIFGNPYRKSQAG